MAAEDNNGKGNMLNSFEEVIDNDKDFLHNYLEKHGYAPKSIEKSIEKFAKKAFAFKKFQSPRIQNKSWSHASVKKLLEENVDDEDPINIIRKKSRELVLQAFTKGWEGPPFDLIELAKLNNIQVSPFELVPDARILPIEGGTFKIEYNPSQSPARINFSVAHEIGHTLFTDCSDTIRYRENKLESNSWELEFLCNVAASELLLPYAAFSNEANSIEPSIDSIIELARKYKASVEAVFLRFCDVIEKPCSIAIASFDENGLLVVDYSKGSKSSNFVLPKGFVIPANSEVYQCKKSGWTSNREEKWEIFDNERYKVYGLGLSPIKRQTRPRVGIFIIPKVFDLKPSKAIHIVFGDATNPQGYKEKIKIIAQVVNTSGALGFGFGRALSTKFPQVKESVKDWKKASDFHLGKSRLLMINKNLYVFQMLAQQGIRAKTGSVPLRYDSLKKCLQLLATVSKELNASVHMPAIGAGQAKGDWNIIKGMIYDELVSNDINVKIYLLPGSNMKPNLSRSLTLFVENEE